MRRLGGFLFWSDPFKNAEEAKSLIFQFAFFQQSPQRKPNSPSQKLNKYPKSNNMFISKKTLMVCIAFAAFALQNIEADQAEGMEGGNGEEPKPCTNSTSGDNNNSPPISTDAGTAVEAVAGTEVENGDANQEPIDSTTDNNSNPVAPGEDEEQTQPIDAEQTEPIADAIPN